jgi:hypothetical protein
MRRLERAALAALLIWTAGCDDGVPAAGGTDGDPVRGGTAVIVSATDFDFLNALVSADRYTQEVLRYALFVPLLRYDAALDYEPALARAWEWRATPP